MIVVVFWGVSTRAAHYGGQIVNKLVVIIDHLLLLQFVVLVLVLIILIGRLNRLDVVFIEPGSVVQHINDTIISAHVVFHFR